jgi:hypothetical protein
MGKIQISICENCRKQTCDGGMWQMIKCIHLKDGIDTVDDTPVENLTDCTLKWLGRNKKFANLPIGHIIVKKFHNWCAPAEVTLKRIS